MGHHIEVVTADDLTFASPLPTSAVFHPLGSSSRELVDCVAATRLAMTTEVWTNLRCPNYQHN